MIPLSAPNLSGNEWKYVKECLDTNWVSSVGEFVNRFEQACADYTGAAYAISTVNGTAALHISLLLSDIQPGQYVLVPNITFIASINSIKYVGAEPLLVDVDPDTWQMDLDLLRSFLEKETLIENNKCVYKKNRQVISAIMAVHVLGNMCDMDKLQSLASEFKLIIIEDATEALGSTYKGQQAGTFGKFGCFSFNGNKIITTGGGGMIVTNDAELARKAKHLTTQAKSDPFEYVHDEIGYNYRLVNILAAMGLAQMELLPGFIKRKNEINAFYISSLSDLKDVTFQKTGADVVPNHWLVTLTCLKKADLMRVLLEQKIQVRPLWVPINQLEMYQQQPYITTRDISSEVYKKSISIPCSTGIRNEELQMVVDAIRGFYLNA